MPRSPRRQDDDQSAAIESQTADMAAGSESPLADPTNSPLSQEAAAAPETQAGTDPAGGAPPAAPKRPGRTRTPSRNPRAAEPSTPAPSESSLQDSEPADAAQAGEANAAGQTAARPARSRSSRSRSRAQSRLRRVAAEGAADLDVAGDAELPLDLGETPTAQADVNIDATTGDELLDASAEAPPGAGKPSPDAAQGRRRRVGGRRGSRGKAVDAANGEQADLKAAAPATESETLEIATLIPGLDIDPQPLPGSQATPDGSGGAGQEGGGASEPNSGEGSPGSSRRSRRGGRRRRGGREQAAETPVVAEASGAAAEDSEGGVLELSDAEADSSTVAAVEGEDESAAENARRSRRSQRGGRRRGKTEGADENAETVAAASEASVDFTLPTVPQRERWVAPALVPVLDASAGLIDLGVEARVDAPSAGFVINGEAVPAHLFFVNSDPALLESSDGGGAPLTPEVVAGEIRRAAAAGIHLHTCVTYLPLLNAYGERSFAAVDAAMQSIIEADPDAKLVLRVQCVPTNFWARTHEQEMAAYSDGLVGDVTIASSEFWADCVDALQALLGHVAEENSPARGRVVALHLDKGEWFYEPGAGYDYSEANLRAFRDWLHQKYQTLYALRAAWFDGKVTFETASIPPSLSQQQSERRTDTVLLGQKRDRRVVDYVTYASSVVGSVVCGLASAVKAITGGKLLVFIPYGYLFEFAARNDSGHQALTQVLACDSIDVLTGPNSYLSRAAGGVGGFAAPVDSLPLHNKLWIVEDDTKTYLAASDTPDSYNPKISGQQETVMVLRRNFYAALAHGCGLSWMDLWGQGWLDSDSLWDEIQQMMAASDALRSPVSQDAGVRPGNAPEVAVLVDDASYAWVRGDAGGRQLQSGLIVKARDLLQRSGASIGYYLQSDAGQLPESVKVVIFLNALSVTTAERQAIREHLQTPGKTLVWVYAPGLYDENGPAPSEVTEIVGMPLKAQPWNSQVGTLFTDERHLITERLRGGKRMGTEEALNPSYTAIDPQAMALGVYAQTGEPSIAVKTAQLSGGGAWRSIFVGEPQFTGELVRGILRYAGVHLYDTQDDIVFIRQDAAAGIGLLVVHSPYTGQRVIQLPRPAACYNVTEKRLVAQHSASLRLFLRGRSTQAFFWGDLEAIAQRAGLSVDDLLATQQQPQQRGGGSDEGENRSSGDAAPAYDRNVGEAVEYPHDRDYIVSSERMASTEFASVTQSHESAPAQDGDAEIEPALEQVLRAVVEEVYSGAFGHDAQPGEDAPGIKSASQRGTLGSDKPDALLDARREASRITEALLADVSADADETGDMDDQASGLADDERADEGGGEANGDAAAGQRSSSRRRRWRRKRQQSGAESAGSDTGAPPAPKFSVEQIIGDLLKRRKPSE